MYASMSTDALIFVCLILSYILSVIGLIEDV
jgi:hypothetical protein